MSGSQGIYGGFKIYIVAVIGVLFYIGFFRVFGGAFTNSRIYRLPGRLERIVHIFGLESTYIEIVQTMYDKRGAINIFIFV